MGSLRGGAPRKEVRSMGTRCPWRGCWDWLLTPLLSGIQEMKVLCSRARPTQCYSSTQATSTDQAAQNENTRRVNTTQPSLVSSCSLVFCHLAESWLTLLETVSVLDTWASICTHLPLDTCIWVVLALQQTLMVERHALKLFSEGSDYKLPFVKGEKHTRELFNVPPSASQTRSFWHLVFYEELGVLKPPSWWEISHSGQHSPALIFPAARWILHIFFHWLTLFLSQRTET